MRGFHDNISIFANFYWNCIFFYDFRVLLYQAVEDTLFKFGYEGKACLLRAICEMHESPLIGYGFFGEVLELFLTWVTPQTFTMHYLTIFSITKNISKNLVKVSSHNNVNWLSMYYFAFTRKFSNISIKNIAKKTPKLKC